MSPVPPWEAKEGDVLNLSGECGMKGKAAHSSGVEYMCLKKKWPSLANTGMGDVKGLEAGCFADLLYFSAVAQSMGCLQSPLEMCTLRMYWICPWTPMSLPTASATRSPMGR